MTLSETGRAIGAVTRLLRDNLSTVGEVNVTIGRPESQHDNNSSHPSINIFLYEVDFDRFLKNTSLSNSSNPPVWLVLKYLLTAFDSSGDSDSPEAHDLIGQSIQMLQTQNFMSVTNQYTRYLKDNPEVLKITFNESSSDLLHKLMQGSDEKYRFSVCFEVRPVMIASTELPSYSLLVGLDYTQTPAEEIGTKGIQIPVITSFNPSIKSISPTKFEVGSIINIFGNNFNSSNMELIFDSTSLQFILKTPNNIELHIDDTAINGDLLSAGSHTIRLVQTLSTEKKRSSNVFIVNLLPTFTSASIDSLNSVNIDGDTFVFGKIILQGLLLGTNTDDIYIGLYKDGKIVKLFDDSSEEGNIKSFRSQTEIQLEIKEEDPIPQGIYHIILNTNGQQARNSPQVELSI